MYGSNQGLTATGDGLLFDPANPEANDVFGASLAAGDFDGDGFTDLAVGAFADNPVGLDVTDSGSVFVFYSDGAGVSQTVYQNWYPGHLGLRSTPAANAARPAVVPSMCSARVPFLEWAIT